MERKLVRNQVIAEKYKNTIQEYLDRDYAQNFTTDQTSICNGITSYIHHRCVSSKNIPDKIRVAFDAGAK